MEHSKVVASPQELQISLAVLGTDLSGMPFLEDLWAPQSTGCLWAGGIFWL